MCVIWWTANVANMWVPIVSCSPTIHIFPEIFPPISLLSEELRSIFFFFKKKATLKGHPDYLPTLIPGQRPNLFFKNPPKMESPKHHQPFQQLPVSSFAYVHPTYFSPATEFHQPSPQSITQIYQERSSFLRASLQQPCSLSFPGWTILFIIIPIFLPFIKILNFKMLSSFKSFSWYLEEEYFRISGSDLGG